MAATRRRLTSVVVVAAVVVVEVLDVDVVVSAVSVISPWGVPVFRLKKGIIVPGCSSSVKMSETRTVQGEACGRRHSKRQLPSSAKDTTA